MTIFNSLEHTSWICKYHIIFVPKKRKAILFGKIRNFLRKIFHELASQKGCKIEGGKIMNDHVHMLISIPPKLSVSNVVGYMKGKCAIAIARKFRGIERNFNGESFWARGYCVSTVGYEENKVLQYIQNQQELDEYSGEF